MEKSFLSEFPYYLMPFEIFPFIIKDPMTT